MPLSTFILAASVLVVGLVSAQPGPYAVWAVPTTVPMGQATVHGDRVFAMPHMQGVNTIPFEIASWNLTTGTQLFSILTAWSNATQDMRGLAPAVTRIPPHAKHNAGRLVVVYAFHESSALKAIDAETGVELWTQGFHEAGCGILQCEFVGITSPGDGIIIVEQPSNLTRLDAATGEIVWFNTLSDNDGNPGSTRTHVAYAGDNALIWSCRDRLHRVDLATGGFLWSSVITLPDCSAPFDGCVLTDLTPPKVVGKYIIVGGGADFWQPAGLSGPGVILCLWALTGALRWYSLPAYFIDSVAASASIVVANPEQLGQQNSPPNSTFAVFDTEAGTKLWTLNASANYFTDAVVSDPGDYVAVGVTPTAGFSQSFNVYAGRTGAVIGTMGSTIAQRPFAEASGNIVIVSVNQNSYGLTALYVGNGNT